MNPAGPVKITRRDGSVEYRPAHGARRPSIPGSVERTVFARDGLRCRYCGHQGPAFHFHLEHVVAYMRGGLSTTENLVVSCRRCNSLKGMDTWKPRLLSARGQLTSWQLLRLQGCSIEEANRRLRARDGLKHRRRRRR